MAEAAGSTPNTLVRLVIGFFELWVLAIVLILGAAFLLSLFGANPDTGFSSFIFDRASDLMRPFNGMFSDVTFNGDSIVNTSLLFAIFVYVVIGAVLGAIARRF